MDKSFPKHVDDVDVDDVDVVDDDDDDELFNVLHTSSAHLRWISTGLMNV